MGLFGSKAEKTPAQTVVEDVLRVKKNETALIIANPETTVMAQELFTALADVGARPTLIFQHKKSGGEAAEPSVIGALKSAPNVVLSISAQKLGLDPEATASPYKTEDGKNFDSIFDYLLEGTKATRAVWTPGLTQDMFMRTVNIDYKLLADRCKKICAKYAGAVSVHVTSPNGTDVTVPVQGRSPFADNGDFSTPGTGGNIPAGEVFISPVVGTGNTAVLEAGKKFAAVKNTFGGMVKSLVPSPQNAEQQGAAQQSSAQAQEPQPSAEKAATHEATEAPSVTAADPTAESPAQTAPAQTAPAQTAATPAQAGTSGTIVFDGSMTFADGDALLDSPITVRVEQGFVTEVSGGKEAQRLLRDIQAAEREALAMEASGKLPAGSGPVYCRNARNIGELGIGLNPAANVTGNMLEDEKAFRTCHFAIGRNYDGDAPALIHFDGIVRNPTIILRYQDGTEFTLLDRGDLKI